MEETRQAAVATALQRCGLQVSWPGNTTCTQAPAQSSSGRNRDATSCGASPDEAPSKRLGDVLAAVLEKLLDLQASGLTAT